MKATPIVKFAYVFILSGIGMLIGAILMYKSTSTFLAEATKAEGTVVDLVEVESESSDSTTYSPVVHFINQDGQRVEFTSSAGSNPPSYSKGQKVEVLYRPTEPQNAEINGFFSLWGGSVIVGGMGGVFFLVGINLEGSLKRRKNEFLRKNGTPIETDFQSVEQNTALSVNGKHPFIVLTQWQNPSTSELHIFKSDNQWFDPSSYIKSKKITVFIEKNNPKKYFVDLSFLPNLAK